MKEHYEKYTVPITAGCVANVVGICASLPLAYGAFQQQSKNPLTYRQLLVEFKTLQGWSKAYKALVPAIKMAPLQSLGYSSVVIYYTESYKKSVNPDNPNSVKITLPVAALAGLYSAASESLLSVYYLKKMFDRWNRSHVNEPMSHTTFSRIFLMTLIKNGVANPLTVISVYAAKLQLDQRLAEPNSTASVCESSPRLSALAGFAGALGANLIFAPLVTLQTRVLESPQHSLGWHLQTLWNQGPKVMWAGVAARSAAKAIQSAVGFGLIPVLVSTLKDNRFGFCTSTAPPEKAQLSPETTRKIDLKS